LRLIDVHASAIRAAFVNSFTPRCSWLGYLGAARIPDAAPQWRGYLELEMTKKYVIEVAFITALVLSVAYLWFDIALAHHIIL
jgi:hypothetical protein